MLSNLTKLAKNYFFSCIPYNLCYREYKSSTHRRKKANIGLFLNHGQMEWMPSGDILDLLVLPSGSKVSSALRGYPEQVILEYLQNSRADSSSISLNTEALPSWQAKVNGVNPALFILPLLAGTFGWRKA